MKQQERSDQDENNDISVLDDSHQPLPLAPEEKAGTRDHSNPAHGSEKIKDDEAFPRHAQNAGQRSGNDPHSEDEVRQRDRHGAPLLKDAVADLDQLRMQR